jgi:hypothetical protein
LLIYSLYGTIGGGMVGFVGYFLAMDEHYKQLMVVERWKPCREKDAGLAGWTRKTASRAAAPTHKNIAATCGLPH